MKKINNVVMYIIYDIINICVCKSNYYDLSEYTSNKKNKGGKQI